jgi:hypothetical protein
MHVFEKGKGSSELHHNHKCIQTVMYMLAVRLERLDKNSLRRSGGLWHRFRWVGCCGCESGIIFQIAGSLVVSTIHSLFHLVKAKSRDEPLSTDRAAFLSGREPFEHAFQMVGVATAISAGPNNFFSFLVILEANDTAGFRALIRTGRFIAYVKYTLGIFCILFILDSNVLGRHDLSKQSEGDGMRIGVAYGGLGGIVAQQVVDT